MKVAIIHGSERKGSTYHAAQLFVQKLAVRQQDVVEFFLPRDMSSFCTGCCNCFAKGEEFCPHARQVGPIRDGIQGADVLVFTTPVYVLRASAQMKALLDHLAFLFMTHRPSARMFSKVAVIFSTGAGGGMRPAMKDIATSLKFWGVAKIYRMGTAVFASEWSGVSHKKKEEIEKKVGALAHKVSRRVGNVRPGIATKALFGVFRQFHKKMKISELDVRHWERAGWLGSVRPWR